MALALLLPVVLASCGGLGSTAGGGIGGTGVGPVTGFGSVIVNGVRYDDTGIDNTTFFDDNGRAKADLKAGMMVAIYGSINGANGTADNIAILRHVDGPMDDNGVDLATNTASATPSHSSPSGLPSASFPIAIVATNLGSSPNFPTM